MLANPFDAGTRANCIIGNLYTDRLVGRGPGVVNRCGKGCAGAVDRRGQPARCGAAAIASTPMPENVGVVIGSYYSPVKLKNCFGPA